MNYISFAIFAAVGFGFYNFFVGKSGGKISPFLATAFLTISGFILTIIASLFQKYFAGEKLLVTNDGIKFAVLAGVAAGIAEIFYFFAFSKNTNVSIVLPIVFTLTVITGVILGVIFDNETLSSMKVAGILLGILGLFLLTR